MSSCSSSAMGGEPLLCQPLNGGTNQPAMSGGTKIIAQPRGGGVRICKSDIPVRPNEINCHAPQASAPHLRLPRERVQRNLKVGADFGQGPSRFPVHPR